MKPRLTSLLFIPLALASAAWAQCPFTPTIEPDSPVLCPNESITLGTQAYDAYQWYKDGGLIPDATGPTLPVSAMLDGGSSFTVAATLDGCTEMSAAVIVDGWIFLPPYVVHGGDEPLSGGPDLVFCDGDTLLLTLSPGYTQNIIWTNNDVPIPGGTSTTLAVTTPGNYSVSAGNGTCPDYVQGIGVTVDVDFLPVMKPELIALDATTLCVYPAGNSTQWYLAGVPIDDTTDCITITSGGPYTAFVDYGQPCQELSDPWMTTGIRSHGPASPSIGPNPAGHEITVTWPPTLGGPHAWVLRDMTGRKVLEGDASGTDRSVIRVEQLPAGSYLFAPRGHAWRPVRVVVAR